MLFFVLYLYGISIFKSIFVCEGIIGLLLKVIEKGMILKIIIIENVLYKLDYL